MRRVLTLLPIAALLAACSSEYRAPVRTDVPEPAVAPVTAAVPAGRVVPLPGQPEGLVVDAASRTIAVGVRGPDGVALLDADTLAERQRVPLAGAPRHLAPGPAGTVLVPSEGNDRLYTVGLTTGSVDGDAPTGRQPHDAAGLPDGRVFVTDELADTVSIVEGGRRAAVLPSPQQPGGIAASVDGASVLVVGVRGRQVEAYRPDGSSLGRAPAGVGPTHVRPGAPGRFYVADTQGDAVLVFAVDGGAPHEVGRIATGGTPYGLGVDRMRQRLYVSLTATNQLRSFRIDGDRLVAERTWPTVRQPDDVAVDEATGRVVVTGTAAGELQLIDPAA